MVDERSSNDDSEKCRTCLWTGMVTCGGMAAYFAHTALDPQVVAKSRYNKPIFVTISCGWVVVGAYRYYLG